MRLIFSGEVIRVAEDVTPSRNAAAPKS